MSRTWARRLLLGGAGWAAAVGGLYAAGARFNSTPSFPRGLYWITATPIERGSLVLACPPPSEAIAEARRRGYLDAGFCPGGSAPLIKRVAALGGDWVTVAPAGVEVNGSTLPNSRPLAADADGRPLPVYRTEGRTLAPGEVLLMSDFNPLSFDGRYFGPIERGQVQAVVRPVWVTPP
jgi:conjugative transfer signal peptidase TraF